MPSALNLSSILALQALPSGNHLSILELAATGAFLLGLVCDAWLVRKFFPNPRFQVDPKPWGLAELGFLIVFLFGLFSLSSILYIVVGKISHTAVADLTSLIIPMEMVLRLGVLAAFIIYFRYRHIKIAQAVGAGHLDPIRAVAWGLVFAFGALPAVGIVSLTTQLLFKLFHFQITPQPIIDVFLKTQSPVLLAILVFFAVAVAPVFEEFIFRGFAYPALKQRFGMLPALLIISALFSINHLHAPSLLPLFVLALGLGLAYELTGSLLTSITMHSAFNALMVLQIFYERAHR